MGNSIFKGPYKTNTSTSIKTEKGKACISKYICFLYIPSIWIVPLLSAISGLYPLLIFMNSAKDVIQTLNNKKNEQKSEIKFENFRLITQNEDAPTW